MRTGGHRGVQSKAKGLDDSVHSVCTLYTSLFILRLVLLLTGTTCSSASCAFVLSHLVCRVIEHLRYPPAACSSYRTRNDKRSMAPPSNERTTFDPDNHLLYPFLVLFFACRYTLMLRLMLPLRLSKYHIAKIKPALSLSS